MKEHPLFPDKPEADIETVHVTRFEHGRETYAAQKYGAGELTEVGQIFDRYGGGAYVLVAHGRNKAGKVGIVARADYVIGGAPKPLNPPGSDGSPAAPSVVYAPAPSGNDGMMIMIMQQAGEDRRAMMQLIATMNKPAPVQDNSAVLVALIESQGRMMQAALEARSAPVAAPGAGDAMKTVLDVLQMGNELRAGTLESIADKVKGGELDLGAVAEGANKLVDVLRKVKTLADDGAAPEEVAAAAAAAAAE